MSPRPGAGAPKAREAEQHKIVIVGAGPVGLALAIDLAQQGVAVLLLDEKTTQAQGSRGVCHARRTLEILDRLGVADDCVAHGVSWDTGRTFFRDAEVYSFNLLPQPDYHRPGMINLQQYHLENYLLQRAQSLKNIELRSGHKLIALREQGERLALHLSSEQGTYAVQADWLVACDGARSTVRRSLGLEAEGKLFMDRFLVADVVMKADFPAERWFWFDPPFHPGQSVLLHHQADNVWRIDFQLGWEADPELEKQPQRVAARIRAMLGEDHDFELVWVAVYTFQCRRMASFRHGRVLFAGDAAHQVSPFGARGSNSGIQDADNLAWKLRFVIDGLAPARLLDSYSSERTAAADENLENSARAMEFITPRTRTSMAFRNAVLDLARKYPFARALVNSGRLSVPTILKESVLNSPDTAQFTGEMLPGAPAADCPMRAQVAHFWLLERLGGSFALLVYVDDPAQVPHADALQGLISGKLPLDVMLVTPAGGRSPHGFKVMEDYTGRFAERYDAQSGSVWLLRPDQHIAARWRELDIAAVRSALEQASGNA